MKRELISNTITAAIAAIMTACSSNNKTAKQSATMINWSKMTKQLLAPSKQTQPQNTHKWEPVHIFNDRKENIP